MNRFFISICSLGLAGASMSALNISVTPGQLVEHYADLCNTADEKLVISGTADASDLSLLQDLSKYVKTLDLTDLSIEGGEISPLVLAGSMIENVTLPLSLKSIGESAFVGSRIQSVIIPESVENIGDYAFANSSSLKNVVLKGNPTLGIGVFKDCASLLTVEVKEGLTSIPDYTFSGCSSLTSEIPASARSIGDFAYRGTALESVDLSNVEKIGDYAFADMKQLKSILASSLSENGLSLGKGVFFNDDALTEVPVFIDTEMSKSIFSHTSGNFPIWTAISSEVIPEAAYANNTDIDTVILHSKVRRIEAHAFRNNTNLKMINVELLGSNPPEADSEAFSGLLQDNGKYNIKLNVTEGTNEAWANAPVWQDFEIGHFVTGIDDVADELGAEIRISKTGNMVVAESTRPVEYVGVFSLNGMVLHESSPNVESVRIEIPGDDLVVVKVISGGLTRIVKIK